VDYITAKEASEKWNISVRRIQTLCSQNRILGAKKMGDKLWVIPEDAEKPKDARISTRKYIKNKKKQNKKLMSI